MATEDDIQHYQKRLSIYRRNLTLSLEKEARLGLSMPSHLLVEIDEIRESIRQTKATLRIWGVVVTDHPDDDDKVSLPGGSSIALPLPTGTITVLFTDIEGQYPRQLGRTGRRLARVNPPKAGHGTHELRE